MKNIYDYLYFKLGEEFSTYEFQIIPIPPYEFIENGISLEPYEYYGDIKEIFGLMVKQIILYFNADVLMKVEFIFNGDFIDFLKLKLEELSNMPAIMFLKLYYEERINETVLMYYNKTQLS